MLISCRIEKPISYLLGRHGRNKNNVQAHSNKITWLGTVGIRTMKEYHGACPCGDESCSPFRPAEGSTLAVEFIAVSEVPRVSLASYL